MEPKRMVYTPVVDLQTGEIKQMVISKAEYEKIIATHKKINEVAEKRKERRSKLEQIWKLQQKETP